eukprot:Gb_12042 [translate_table: standard]
MGNTFGEQDFWWEALLGVKIGERGGGERAIQSSSPTLGTDFSVKFWGRGAIFAWCIRATMKRVVFIVYLSICGAVFIGALEEWQLLDFSLHVPPTTYWLPVLVAKPVWPLHCLVVAGNFPSGPYTFPRVFPSLPTPPHALAGPHDPPRLAVACAGPHNRKYDRKFSPSEKSGI